MHSHVARRRVEHGLQYVIPVLPLLRRVSAHVVWIRPVEVIRIAVVCRVVPLACDAMCNHVCCKYPGYVHRYTVLGMYMMCHTSQVLINPLTPRSDEASLYAQYDVLVFEQYRRHLLDVTQQNRLVGIAVWRARLLKCIRCN